jgi:ATPase family associated with various cellular activities (AAA)
MFDHLPRTAETHFKLNFYAAVHRLLGELVRAFGALDTVRNAFPFLVGYADEIAALGVSVTHDDADAWWRAALTDWERRVSSRLPLRALREALALDARGISLLMTIGLVEEDARFGAVFESGHGIVGQRRPTTGLLSAWWRDSEHWAQARGELRRLHEAGLIQVINPEAPRLEWAWQVAAPVWDVLRGETHERLVPGLLYYAPEKLEALEELIFSAALSENIARLPALLESGQVRALIVRGAQHNGRHTLLGAIARAMGRGILSLNGLENSDDARWHYAAALATALHALPVVEFDLAPGETATVPAFTAYDGPLGVVLGKQGGVVGENVECALTLQVAMPEAEARKEHWRRAVSDRFQLEDVTTLSEQFCMTSGNLRRAAQLAGASAALAGRTTITLEDAQQASRTLNRQMLDTLVARLNVSGDWGQLVVDEQTRLELVQLEQRCRHRERLQEIVAASFRAELNAGVRALFTGPSGTGKTLAARLLASALQMDLYRLDLSAVVNKYIGETEKNLSQLFARAEELDVILLLDEGDALLTQRTNVQSSTDRYANLETNYLLQRLETYEGIVIITTNAGERIDRAFKRRLDVVIDFHPPGIEERWAIWQVHLPPTHTVAPAFLEQVAQRCTLSGGQIRNAVLHASLLALDDGGIVTVPHLEGAIQREYRKAGGVCPLRAHPF